MSGTSRIDKARELLTREGLDALALCDGPNLRYFTGFTGSNGLLLITHGEPVFFTDSRYTIQAGREVSVASVVTAKDLDQALAEVVNAGQLTSIALCEGGLSHQRWRKFDALMPGVRLAQSGAGVARLRAVKEEAEVKAMREASRLSEECFGAIAQLFKPGVTEREVAFAFVMEVLRSGGEGLAFDTIVAAGPRAALPHAKPSQRPFEEGELVVFDFGVVLDGYCSDQTVTVPIGEVPEEQRRVYDLVNRAQRAAIGAVKPGVALKEVDGAARSLIAAEGYGELFGHGTGHGIGLEIHEYPTVGPNSEVVAEVGMVFTVEPGIYLRDGFGVRLEDTVEVTEEGCSLLTSLDKGLGACFASVAGGFP